jgi:hypothetical protein
MEDGWRDLHVYVGCCNRLHLIGYVRWDERRVCLGPCGVRIEVRFVPKCRERLMGCVGGEVGVDRSFSVRAQASGEVSVGSREASTESRYWTVPG